MSWKKVKLSEFLKTRELRFKPNAEEVKNLQRIDKIKFDGTIFLSNAPSKTDMILIKNGDLVISGINVHKGAIAVYEGKEDITATIHYSSYEYDKNKIDVEFLKIFLKSSEFLDAIKEQVPGGIKTEIKAKHLLPLEVEIPDIDEQKVIFKNHSAFETSNKNLNSEIEKQNSLLIQLRQAFLREAMQGKLIPQDKNDEPASELLKKIKAEKEKLIAEKIIKKGKIQEASLQDEILFEIPASWVWCKLDDLCLNITDGTHITPNYTNSGRIFLSAQNVKPFKFMPHNHKLVSEEAYQEYNRGGKAKEGDILIARVGAGIGEAAVIDKRIDFCFYVSLALIQPFKHHVDSNYLTYVFNSPYGVQYAKGNISSKGGSAGNFNLGRIRSFLIPLPPLAEQQRIVTKLEQLMQLCSELEKNINQSKEETNLLLQTVLREALEGREN